MEKPLQYCKVISLQLIKINEKKIIKEKKKNVNWHSYYGEQYEVSLKN